MDSVVKWLLGKMKNSMGNGERLGAQFRMPLHCPRYTEKDYETMPEWKVDRLLADYGMPVVGDLDKKRKFAMVAFLSMPH